MPLESVATSAAQYQRATCNWISRCFKLIVKNNNVIKMGNMCCTIDKIISLIYKMKSKITDTKSGTLLLLRPRFNGHKIPIYCISSLKVKWKWSRFHCMNECVWFGMHVWEIFRTDWLRTAERIFVYISYTAVLFYTITHTHAHRLFIHLLNPCKLIKEREMNGW